MGLENIPDTNQNHISFGLFGFDIAPNEISEELGLTPKSIGIKDEIYFIGPPDKRIEKVLNENHWKYEWKLNTNEFIGDIVDRFVKEIIEPRKDPLKKLTRNSYLEFQIVQYYYDGCNPGIHINKENVTILAELGASIDIDIYCLADETPIENGR